ncbi:hypothetical protein G9A89_007664 [Geosiphon pyriformis]|nr:hypothetical protein G9A89_007664 [Geosiphon pyriformis]
MAYAPIAKLDNFTGEEDDTQKRPSQPMDGMTPEQYKSFPTFSRIPPIHDFNAFKIEFLRYFSNNNSINCLVNTFTTMKQRETEVVTTYLGHFHRNLHQIQAIDANYFTAPQILNQFICGLRSSILQHVRPLHPGTLQDTVTCTRDFESTKSKANHAQAINLVINRSSEVDSKLENLHNDAIIKETLIVPKINHVHLHQPINSGNRKRVSATIVVNKDIFKLTVAIPKSKPTHLPTSDTVISLSISGVSSSNLSTTATSNLSTTTATNNLSTPTNPNTTPKLSTQWNSKTENNSTELEISDSSPSTNPQFFTATIWITPNLNSQNYLSLLVTSEDTSTNNSAFTQKQPLTSNIPSATITEDKSLAAIFPFEFEKTTTTSLFSEAALEAKPITVMYTDVKVEGQFIKLILDSGHQVNQAVSTRIITANGATKTPIGKIDDFSFKVNSIMTPIKVLVMEATQYQALVGNDWLSKVNTPPKEKLLIELEEEKEKPTWEAYQREKENTQANNTYISYTYSQQQSSTYRQPKLICIDCGKKLSSMGACCVGKWDNTPCIACGETFLDEGIWNDILGRGGTYDVFCQYTILISNWLPEEKLYSNWTVVHTITMNYDVEPVINFLEPEEFHEHYQNLAPTRKEQEQWLVQLNTRLCHHCLISSDFEYCDDCDLIYNLPSCMIYTIFEEEKPISSCALESELLINHDPDFDDDDKNTGSNLSKKQELKWYSDNGEGIMPERAHDTDAGFDLRYSEKEVIKLEPHSCTCIDLKVALEIPATTMVQLASRNSLTKRGINIRGGIIDAGYVGNIIAILQNDSEKVYIIEPNKKIAQAIFLSLVRVAQLVLVEKREELGITVREIQGFGSMGRIDVPVNMAEEEIVGQREIISTSQAISISPYNQYMLTIERKEKDQAQIFEAEASLCELGEVGLINLHIPAKDYSHIKIPIYNNTGNVIEIPARTIIEYLNTEMENQPPNPIPDFPQLCGYVNITSQTIYRQSECYLFQLEQLKQINMKNLDPLQCMQLKMLLNQFNNIFASKNEFG